MSAADRIVVRTASGEYKSVPRRIGVGMIATRRAKTVPAKTATSAVKATKPVKKAAKPKKRAVSPAAVATAAEQVPDAVVEQMRERVVEALDLPPEAVSSVDDDVTRWTEADPITTPELDDVPEEPKSYATKAKWSEYARAVGATVTDNMTKPEIRDAAQEAAQALVRLSQPAHTVGGRLDILEDEPVPEVGTEHAGEA